MREAAGTRGESCYLVETPDEYLAHVEEALGTKILVADASTPRPDGATTRRSRTTTSRRSSTTSSRARAATVVAMYAAVGDNEYLADARRAADLAQGFADACVRSGAAWGGGETQILKAW